MRFLACLLLVALAACTPAGPDLITPKPLPVLAGPIAHSLHLSGDVVLADDVRVLPGVELVLEAGSTVWVRPAGSTKIEPDQLSARTEILVEGLLRISGRPGAPVRFRTLKPQLPIPEGDPLWAGILVLPGGSVHVDHAELPSADHGLWLLGGEAVASDLTLRDCRYGIEVTQGSGLELRRARVRGGELGLFCTGSARLVMADSVFQGQDEAGLHLASACRIDASRIEVRDSQVGLVAEDVPAGLKLTGNRVELLRPGGGQ
ncbi:MAG: hypothetical protein Kow00100_06060 [Geothermobacteraceae bacterium]